MKKISIVWLFIGWIVYTSSQALWFNAMQAFTNCTHWCGSWFVANEEVCTDLYLHMIWVKKIPQSYNCYWPWAIWKVNWNKLSLSRKSYRANISKQCSDKWYWTVSPWCLTTLACQIHTVPYNCQFRLKNNLVQELSTVYWSEFDAENISNEEYSVTFEWFKNSNYSVAWSSWLLNWEYAYINRWNNTPYIYSQWIKELNWVNIELKSEKNKYFNQIPNFNIYNGRKFDIKDDKFLIENKKLDYLYYELETPEIILNRNWILFDSKDQIIDYLSKSDFYSKLWFSEVEKNNSINVIIKWLEKINNKYYYLNLLSKNAIEDIVKNNIDADVKVIRKYIGIYPTDNKIPNNWEFVFPTNNISWKYLKDYWEIIVNGNMMVFWE